jgi:hypothetical protein
MAFFCYGLQACATLPRGTDFEKQGPPIMKHGPTHRGSRESTRPFLLFFEGDRSVMGGVFHG